MGAAGLANALCAAAPSAAPLLVPCRNAATLLSALLQLVLLLRLGLTCGCVELESLRLSGAHGALLVAIELALAQAPVFAPSESEASVRVLVVAAVYLVKVLQLGIYAHFVHRLIAYRARVEPFWTPVMLFMATNPLVPMLPAWLRHGGLALGVLTTALMWPPCVLRMLRRPSKCADPSIFMLMAPVAFCTLGLLAEGGAQSGGAPLLALWLLNAASLALCAFCAYQRRAALRAALSPFAPSWVGLIFPLASNANVALSLRTAQAGGAIRAFPYAVPLVALYGVLVPATAVLAVPAVVVAWVCSVPRWLFVAPVARPGSMRMDVPSEGSGVWFVWRLRRSLRLSNTVAHAASALRHAAADAADEAGGGDAHADHVARAGER